MQTSTSSSRPCHGLCHRATHAPTSACRTAWLALLLTIVAASSALAQASISAVVTFEPRVIDAAEAEPQVSISLRVVSNCNGTLAADEGWAGLDSREGDGATADEDFTPGPNRQPLQAFEVDGSIVTLDINVTNLVLDDNLYEGTDPESFEVALTDPGTLVCVAGEFVFPVILTTGPPLVVNIVDDEPFPTLSIADVSTLEGDEGEHTVAFELTLDPASQPEVSVDFTIEDGTALGEAVAKGLQETDYRATTSGTVTFPSGEATATIEVDVVGDPFQENDEDFFVRLSNAAGAELAVDEARGVIQNDDAPPAVSIGDAQIEESDDGRQAVTFEVTLSAASDFDVQVDFATLGGTATAGEDFVETKDSLFFNPGETVMTVEIDILGDTLFEDDEDFFVVLSNPQNATLGDSRGRGLILNDDEPITVTIGGDVRVAEGDRGTSDAVFTVVLSRPADQRVSVDFATADGSARAGRDYTAASGTLVFPVGATVQELAVEVRGDRLDERDETFDVVLANAAGAVLAVDRATATIVDDDQPPTLSIADRRAAEGDGGTRAFVFDVTLSAASDRAVTAAFRTREGTAVQGEDFRGRAGRFSLPRGTTSTQLRIEVIGDRTVEEDETFEVELFDVANAVLGRSAATGTILNDDDATAAEVRVVSGDGQTALLTQGLGAPLVAEVVDTEGQPFPGAAVTWTVASGDAALGAASTTTGDDGRTSNTVVLGERTGDVVVTAAVDGIDEPARFTVHASVGDPDAFDEVAGPVASALNRACARTDISAELRAICVDVATAAGAKASALRALAPEEVSAQGQVSLDSPRVQLGNVGARLAALRGGARASSQLALQLGDVRLPVAALAGLRGPHGAPQSADADLLARSLDASLARSRALLYGTPAPAASTAGTAQDSADPGGLLSKRWGFFINGTLGEAERPGTVRETGFDMDTSGLTAGVDYRLSDNASIGVALGYVSDDVELRRDAGALDVEGTSLSLYGTWYRGPFYVDGQLGWGSNDFDMERVIDFLGTRRTTRASPGGDQLSAAFGLGYDVARGSWTIGGFGRLELVDASIDAFEESGAPGFNLAVAEQDFKSLLGQAGVQVSYAASFSWGVLQPSLRLALLHELEDDSRPIAASFAGDPGGNVFAIPTDEPDRDYLNLGLGFSMVMKRGRQAFLFYEEDLSRDDFEAYLLTAGFRFEF